MQIIEGNIVDIHDRRIFSGEIHIHAGEVCRIVENQKKYDTYLCPGFVDAHVHIESSMLTPQHFSDMVIAKGTVSVVSDPHEIANVMGVEGVDFMLRDAELADVKIHTGIPSCVPATLFDASGGMLDVEDVEAMAASGRFVVLSEMMNVPGVLNKDEKTWGKLRIARKYGLRIDGHAPLLSGRELEMYVAAGISTDHEVTSLQEAREKIACGMNILIREGSAAKSLHVLKELLRESPDKVMFCTDDAHPDEILSEGHIDKIVRRLLAENYDLYDVLRAASLNAIEHYGLAVGTLREGEPADFIRIDNLRDFKTLEVYLNGQVKYALPDKNNRQLKYQSMQPVNRFNHSYVDISQLAHAVVDRIDCIGIIPGELLTTHESISVVPSENFESDVQQDVLKLVYINRYQNLPPRIAYIKGFGIASGAFASSISHDSHNILAVGCTDEDILRAVNSIIAHQGGLAVTNKNDTHILPLPVGGIMSLEEPHALAARFEHLNREIRAMGTTLNSPFMTLSFMSLLVIPELKIGEKGLFSYQQFNFIEQK